MAQRKLVHKQFNSPMGLYSAQNVQETLNRELQAFGGNGIEVDEDIQRNLSKSAVLKALQEEENPHQSPYKRVAWPPKSEHRPFAREFTPQPQHQQFSQQPSQGVHCNNQPSAQPQTHYNQSSAQPQTHYNPPKAHTPQPQPQTQSRWQTQPQTQNRWQNQQPQQQQYHQPQQYQQQQYTKPSGQNTFSNPQVHHSNEHNVPVVVEDQYTNNNNQAYPSNWKHVTTPKPVRTGYIIEQPQQQCVAAPPFQGSSWQGQTSAPAYAPSYQNNAGSVNPPQSTGYNHEYDQHHTQSESRQYPDSYPVEQADCNRQLWRHSSQPPPQSQPIVNNQYSNYSQAYRGQSPGMIQLRKEAPFNQRPSPVYSAEPAAASYQGGSNMRGDLKWPPPEYQDQAVVGNAERRRIAAGPVCRPRRVNKDYSTFFAKNHINNYYPGYRVPPGTQHVN